MRDIFICLFILMVSKTLDFSDLFVIGLPGLYITVKSILTLFFPRAHFFFLAKKKNYLEWERNK